MGHRQYIDSISGDDKCQGESETDRKGGGDGRKNVNVLKKIVKESLSSTIDEQYLSRDLKEVRKIDFYQREYKMHLRVMRWSEHGVIGSWEQRGQKDNWSGVRVAGVAEK